MHLGEIRNEGVDWTKLGYDWVLLWGHINGLRLKAENYLVILATITNHMRLWSRELALSY
jgi:hypothetical protein